ncbi:bacteriohemerythrin [Geothrix sp. PMB-07]|uniref:bacteriohemerythrin n=1 Tax=Geothrix sp. PMB-07 TaxID=3068640 RepID=UPI002740A794|nr:hemerythrin family protein [Geothrix sp. PMB-07]WLT30138.1 hemerythrin family protein [Geothrix sp. PMB-07]
MGLQAFIQRFFLKEPQDAAARPAGLNSSKIHSPSGERSTPWRCGVTRLDEQYEILFRLVKQFQALIKAGADTVGMDAALKTLEVHLEGHLALEEAYLEHIEFPGLANHRNLHQTFRHQLQLFQQRIASGDRSAGLELSQVLYAWIKVHVLKEDPLWGEHAKARRRRKALADIS